jgi:hypothetical protein
MRRLGFDFRRGLERSNAMKDQHRLAQLLMELERSANADVETAQLQHAFALFKQLTRRERRRLFQSYEQLVGRLTIWFEMIARVAQLGRALVL